MPRYGKVDRGYGMRLASAADDEGAVYMLNLMKYRGEADYGGAETGVSGREADDRYAPVDVLAAIGATVCFTADVVESSDDWDRVAVVRYATRRSFIEMQARPDFKAKHVHKEAGMDHTIVMGTVPAAGLPDPAHPARLLLEVWRGETPPGDGVEFTVEGTILGDGRGWDGVRYRPVEGAVDLGAATPDHQLLVLDPVIERWA